MDGDLLYVADRSSNHRVVVLDRRTGSYRHHRGFTRESGSDVHQPACACVDGGAHLYVADLENGAAQGRRILRGRLRSRRHQHQHHHYYSQWHEPGWLARGRAGGERARPGMRRTRASSRCGWLAVEGE